MGILSKKTNNLLQSLSLIFKRHESTAAAAAAANKHKLLLKSVSLKEGDSRPSYEFSLLTPENLSLPDYYRFCNRGLERYLEFCPSCNGLVYVYNKSGDAAVRNNSTKEGISLPSHRKKGSSIVMGSAFGFDPTSEDYKVVRFVEKCIITGEEVDEDEDELDCRSGVEVYSFKSNSWKWISDFERLFFSPSAYLKGPSVYVNGRSFWKRESVIVSFDFADEVFSALKMPDIGRSSAEQDRLFVFDLLEFDGSLAAVVYPRLGSKKLFEIWVMKEEELWVRELSLHLSEAKRPVGFWKNGEVLFFENVKRGGRLLAYDLVANDFIELHIPNKVGNMEFIPYVESMLPIKEQLKCC